MESVKKALHAGHIPKDYESVIQDMRVKFLDSLRGIFVDKIAVLIPCYNEEKTIEKVVRDFQYALPEAAIYVYDNDSEDKTAEIAESTGAVVRHEYRRGKGNVVRRMFREVDAECYLIVDGDDTYGGSSKGDGRKSVFKKGRYGSWRSFVV